jgi:hypothetical protein
MMRKEDSTQKGSRKKVRVRGWGDKESERKKNTERRRGLEKAKRSEEKIDN